jgi:hypothetical protein
LRRDFQFEELLHCQAPAQVHGEGRQVIHAVGQGDRLLIVLNFEFLFDAGVQETDVRLAGNNVLAVQFQYQAQHAMGGRVLRPHVEDHAAPAGGRLFRVGYQSRDGWFAHGLNGSLTVAALIGVGTAGSLMMRSRFEGNAPGPEGTPSRLGLV